ncbi:hypothetical protein J421_3383 [Gemmatirosa kalamazoonensis]|uniref:Uncharacterized protein n=1 Tax=Gemmatirosa kalamazoonensis TaxID=861299 RepID=W0RKR9_9BACT|nr:hypothetical protein [Gemmatirosa kalamazoonensis]AHG90920.1 hypothetical protein J421_3383 [Gemmatirosa kalamazoonensis]
MGRRRDPPHSAPPRSAPPHRGIRRALLVGIACLVAIPLPAQDELTGDPIDYGFGSSRVCCIDVAGVNLLKYLERVGRITPPSAKPYGEQQENFHKIWDPDFKSPGRTSAQDFQKAMQTSLDSRGYTANVKLFSRRQLDYATLVQEWKNQELIVLFLASGPEMIGHAVFLWGLELDLTKPPRISIVDPNIQPNTGFTDQAGNSPTTVNGKPYTGGTASQANLSIGTDPKTKLPVWKFTIDQPKIVYGFADGSTETFDAKRFDYQIVGFASVSDVCKKKEPDKSPGTKSVDTSPDPACSVFPGVPEPAPGPLVAGGVAVMAMLASRRRRRIRLDHA